MGFGRHMGVAVCEDPVHGEEKLTGGNDHSCEK